MTSDFAPLRTPRLCLRRFADADADALAAYRAHPDVARYQSWSTCSLAEAEAFVRAQRAVQPGEPGAWFQFAAERIDDGRLVGDVALHVHADEPRQGEVGFTLARSCQGRGYAGEALGAVLSYAFGPLGLHRITAVTDARNVRAAALLERVGMRREGHFRENVWFKGAWGDEFAYALLQSEWAERPR